MHCDTERQDREVMHDVCGPGQRWGDHHGGRTDEGWATSSAAGRIQTGARPAVRVLYAGHADVVARAARKKAESHGGRHPLGHLRQFVSLHRLPEHREGGAIRSREDECGAGRDKVMHKTSPEVGGMGHAIKRKEDLRFIQGRGNYVDDISLPRMVYGQLVRSPYAHARIRNINLAKAKAVPGVLAIVTGEDLAKANLAWMPTLSGDKQMVLATGKVLFQSQEVAFVIAEDRYAAADAAELVEVEYDELPVLVDRKKRVVRGARIMMGDRGGMTI